MKVDERALKNVHTVGGGETPPCVGLTSNTLPKAQSTVSAESSQTGVSTRNAHIAVKPKAQKEEDVPHWYALRATYGREKKAYDYMTAKGITAFYPTIDTVKLIMVSAKLLLSHVYLISSSLTEQKNNSNFLFTTTKISLSFVFIITIYILAEE